MSDNQLAERCGVDTKTVGRWITQTGRVPHARHRWAVSEALGEDETVLWPAATKKLVKAGPDREVAEVFPYRSACPSSLWRSLISKAERELTFAGYTNYFLWLEQARFSSGHAYLSVFRFDDDMIVTPLLTHSVGHDAPTLHLRRHQDDGLFDRFAAHVEELWTRGTPVWEEPDGQA
ncbi:hypothetical protein ACFWR9_20425 [Streptomyces sp. NPDC058534]|uniref:hypothetical protein n=1 Tax=Streptomyces sp. NPDC058534 TaxID=3346541 RepID=UPI0036505EDF